MKKKHENEKTLLLESLDKLKSSISKTGRAMNKQSKADIMNEAELKNMK